MEDQQRTRRSSKWGVVTVNTYIVEWLDHEHLMNQSFITYFIGHSTILCTVNSAFFNNGLCYFIEDIDQFSNYFLQILMSVKQDLTTALLQLNV